MANKQCTFIKADGERCGAWPLVGKDQCFKHDPSTAKDSKAAESLGGKITADKSARRVKERLLGELVEQVDGEIVMDPERPRMDTLDDLQLYAEKQMAAIEEKSGKSWLSSRDGAELRRWSEFLLKLMIVRGLDAASRIRDLERAMDNMDRPEPKQLTVGGQHDNN